MPIRGDVKKEGTLSLDEIIARAMVADDKAIAEQSAEILEKFDKISNKQLGENHGKSTILQCIF